MSDLIPRWGEVFDTDYISKHNQEAAIREAMARPKPLAKRERKSLERRRKRIYTLLKRANYSNLLKRYNQLKEDFKALERIKKNKQKAQSIRMESKDILLKIEPYRELVIELRLIKNRLKEHEHALIIQEQEKRDKRVMRKEAKHFAQTIIERYSALKYRELVYKDGREYRYRVRFEAVWMLPHIIVYKIDVNRITLIGGNKNDLPEGVRVRDLTHPDTLVELSVACQRRVWSPHNDSQDGGLNYPYTNGAFVCVDRNDLVGKIPTYIELGEVLESYRNADRYRYPVPVGVGADKKVQWAYLINTPHLMVNGQIGTGKSNAIICMLSTLIQYHPPDELQLLITDMKQGGDFREFARIPHNLANEVIFTPRRLVDELKKVVDTLYKRQRLIGESGCRNIVDYNARHEDKLARIVIVIDEYSQTRDFDDPTIKKQIDYHVDILARLGRSVGTHLVLGNQQPYIKNIPSEVKSNITLQLSGYQIALGASLSTVGNNRLTKIENVPGRMLLQHGFGLSEVQIPYATEQNVTDAVARAMEWERPSLEGDTEPIIPLKPQLTRDDVIRMVIAEFGGVLAPKKFWGKYPMLTSRPHVERIMKSISSEGDFVFYGVSYGIAKYKAGYRIVPKVQTDNDVPVVEKGMEYGETLELEENENA